MLSINTKQVHRVPSSDIFPVSAFIAQGFQRSGSGFYVFNIYNEFPGTPGNYSISSRTHKKWWNLSLFVFGKSGLHSILSQVLWAETLKTTKKNKQRVSSSNSVLEIWMHCTMSSMRSDQVVPGFIPIAKVQMPKPLLATCSTT